MKRPQFTRIAHLAGTSVNRVALTVWILFSLIPIYWLLQMSFQIQAEAIAIPPNWGWFMRPTIDAYRRVLSSTNLLHELGNSAMVAGGVVILACGAGALAAYALARWPRKRQHNYVFWVLTTRMAPPIAVALPLYTLLKNLSLVDTIIGLVLAQTIGIVGLVTWMLMETFRSIPIEVEEAAMIDGCGYFRTFLHVSLPLARVGLIGAGVLAFLLSWNEFFVASILTSSHAVTASVGLDSLLSYGSTDVSQLAAGSMITLAPAFVVVWAFQRQLVRGLSFGAIKG